ncbi:hypothetical protein HMI54_012706 [Coelomomyces lativittatus]|nr:hypothetical protein HMI54_012706 [Coelomomyces lativittatus]
MLIQNIDANLTVLAKQIVDKRNLKELLQEEVDKLERHTSSKFVLSSFTFARCPRCLQPIEDHMKEREIHGNCMLCDQQELESLKNTLQNLRARHGSEFDRKNAFAQYFTRFLRVAMVQVSKAEISDGDWLPLIDGQRHTQAKTGPDLAIVVLAFHYACLAMCVGNPKYDTAHPKLLIIDEPEQQKMDASQFNRIMGQLTDLADANKDTVQVIVAVTDSRGFENYKVEIQTLLK